MADPERDPALSRTQSSPRGSGSADGATGPSDMGLDATISSETGHARQSGARGPRLAPGLRVGDRLALERRLGMGGMGEVWAARHTVLDKQVAVKFLLDPVSGSDEAAQRFLREAKAAAALDHPGIVDVQDFGDDGGTPYLVMELLAGRPLSEQMATGGRLDWPTARHWLAQISAALGFAHRRGVIHRDLKPSNIFLVEHEDAVTCKIIDFGLAKISRGDAPHDPLTTRTGAILGTPTYMSPEQLKAQEVDARADIYALGCVAYEMLTGVHVFRAGSTTELAAKHLYEAPPAEPLRAADTPPAFVALVLRCLEKDPAARFQSAADLRAALEALPAGASAPSAPSAPALLPPDPSLADATAIDGSSTADLIPRSGAAPAPLASAADLSVRPGRSRRRVALIAGAALALAAAVALLLTRGDEARARARTRAPEARKHTEPTPEPAPAPTPAPAAVVAAEPEIPAPDITPPDITPPDLGRVDPRSPRRDKRGPARPTATPPAHATPPAPEPPAPPEPPPFVDPPAPVPKDTRGDRNKLKDPFALDPP